MKVLKLFKAISQISSTTSQPQAAVPPNCSSALHIVDVDLKSSTAPHLSVSGSVSSASESALLELMDTAPDHLLRGGGGGPQLGVIHLRHRSAETAFSSGSAGTEDAGVSPNTPREN